MGQINYTSKEGAWFGWRCVVTFGVEHCGAIGEVIVEIYHHCKDALLIIIPHEGRVDMRGKLLAALVAGELHALPLCLG